jgi:hypothetical protein
MHRWLLLASLGLVACKSSGGGTCAPRPPVDLGGVDWGDPASASVTQYHNSLSRDGLYVDPVMTRANAALMRVDPSFAAVTNGQAYAQPLFVDGGPGGTDLVIVGTEENELSAFDARDGHVVWRLDSKTLGAPAKSGDLLCGNIRPHQGLHGTGAIDLPSRTLYFDVLTETAGPTFHHFIWGVSIDDGSVRAHFPFDVAAHFPAFVAGVQGERGALIIVGGNLYVPYGGMWGDCGHYYGYLVQVPLADPESATAWHTDAAGAGIWAPGGLASDGTSIFAATGNSFDGFPFGDQDSVLRLTAGPTRADGFAPSEWMSLDTNDLDLGGSGPLVVDGPSGQKWVLAFGKNSVVYVLDREKLGGIGGQLASATLSFDEIRQAAAAWTGPNGLRVVFQGQGFGCPAGQSGNLVAFTIDPPQLDTLWCADQQGGGSPIVTTTDGHSEAIVWAVGTEGDNRLHGFDGESGAEIFAGGCSADQLNTVRRFVTPIVAKGRIYVAADNRVYAFSR